MAEEQKKLLPLIGLRSLSFENFFSCSSYWWRNEHSTKPFHFNEKIHSLIIETNNKFMNDNKSGFLSYTNILLNFSEIFSHFFILLIRIIIFPERNF